MAKKDTKADLTVGVTFTETGAVKFKIPKLLNEQEKFCSVTILTLKISGLSVETLSWFGETLPNGPGRLASLPK